MKIIGQFNLGFIITKHNNDLYILDQHACDEKYKFETLQKTTIIHYQPLLQPMTLELSISEEMIIIDNIHIYELNGFKLKINENAMTGRKIELLGIPFSKSIQFNVNDIHELTSILSDDINGNEEIHATDTVISSIVLRNSDNNNENIEKRRKNDLKLPKLMNMFASRACRSAVMIGSSLESRQMTSIVNNLSTIQQPWNCPHGRPTLKHLYDCNRFNNDINHNSNRNNIPSNFKNIR